MDMPLSAAGFEDSPAEFQPEAVSVNIPYELIIDVLGARFSVVTGGDPAFLNEVLAQFKIMVATTQGISGMQDPLKVDLLTGFLLCDEINKLKLHAEEEQAAAEARIEGDVKEVNRITQKLIERIDRVFEDI